VRPSDENQHGSTRPNLMSARRRAAGNDDKILAKLERGTPAGVARHSAATSVAWLGAGGCAIAILIGALVWVAYVNATTPRPLPLARSKPFPISQAAPEARPSAPERVEQAAAPAPVQLAAAVILDEPVEHYLAPPKPAAAVNKPAPRASAPARAATLRPASYSAQAAKPGRSVATRGRSKASQGTAQASAEPVLDSDVALISAIVAHLPRHSAEGGQTEAASACDNATDPEKKCPVKSGSLLQALRKTTN